MLSTILEYSQKKKEKMRPRAGPEAPELQFITQLDKFRVLS